MATINSGEEKKNYYMSGSSVNLDEKSNIKIPVEEMEELIQIVNRLQEVFAVVSEHSGERGTAVELPQIAVVGAQSSGKSSVLESLVGRSFLPRGPGVVTRRPLVLQLLYTSKKELARLSNELCHPGLEAWGVFLHKPDKRFLKFDDIRQEILDETNRVAGEQFGISKEPILLKIYSSSVNLTLVDLPGLIKVPVGDQPQDIEQRVRDLVLQYIAAPHSIILAIVTANTDIATSESLQLARQVDPAGLRTLAVVTKLDLMEDGTDASDILCGCVVPVRLGIIGVLNRSQRDIQQGKSITQALNDEATFLKMNYPKLAPKHGTPYLAKTLQNLLLEHIRSCLPDIRHRVASLMNHYQSVLKICGQPVQDKGQTLLHIITEFCSEYCCSIKGNSRDIETSELCGGARISYIFQESFGQALDSIHPLAGFNKAAILTAMRNASGTRPGLFVPEVSFELLVKRQIKRLEEPSVRCAELVHQELERVVQTSLLQCNNAMSRFHNLHRRILEVCSDILRAQLPVTNTTIKQLISIQLAYINTSHPDFVRDAREINTWIQALHHDDQHRSGESCSSLTDSVSVTHELLTKIVPSTKRSFSQGSIPQVVPTAVPNADEPRSQNSTIRLTSDRENRDCLVIEQLIKSYFQIVKKSVQDFVPKAIMYCLVNNVMENLQQQLVCQLYRPEQLDELLSESKQICQQRKETNDMIKALDKAANILNDIRDTHRLWPQSITNQSTAAF